MTIQSAITIPAFAAHPAHDIKVDYLTEGGALILADRIARMWALRGAAVTTWVEPVEGTSKLNGGSVGMLYTVRSDLRNGMPQRRIQAGR